MKSFSIVLLTVCTLLTSYLSSATDELAAAVETTLLIEITGLQKASGNLYIAVYDSDDTWLGDDTVLEQQVAIEEARLEDLVCTELDLPPGEYALSIFHDTNDNGKLDTNFIGIPKEPVALSNNARPRFGPPKYKDAVFVVGDEPLTQRISMEKI
jgi:uncharacterized protein (DUF2141 family)